MHVLDNNKKPATHFVEVWSNGQTTNQQDGSGRVLNIEYMLYSLLSTKNLERIHTVAIFKIRLK